MKAKLFCTTGILAGRKYQFTQQATIGSSSACAIVIDAPGIAPVHARIFFEANAGCYFVEEGNVQITTRVDGVPIKRRERLGALHIITFARQFDFIFQTIAVPPQPVRVVPSSPLPEHIAQDLPPAGKNVWSPSPIRKREAAAAEAVLASNGKTLIEDLLRAQPEQPNANAGAVTMVEAVHAAAEKCTLQLEAMRGGKTLGTFALKEGENILGRAPECEIYIDDPSISRRHASLIVSANQVRVRDLGSRNHTYLDKSTVVAESAVAPASRLRFGMIEARLVS